MHGAEWKQYVGMMSAQMDIVGGNFTVELLQAGTIDFDWFSLMPEDAVLGIFRKDLFEKLKDLKPGFMRFPGGCIIEGNNLANRYQWKKTIGPQEHRVYNWNRWAVHGVPNKNFEPEWEYTFESQYSHYGQTYGVGYYEYFLLCEAIGAKPLPVLSVGLACQYQSTELVPIDAPEFQEFIQDALDLIEFANGDVTTVWGAKRAAMGHPEPFGMDRIGIGNEQWQTEFQDFYERYEAFEKAIHAVYPEMKLIGSAGPDVITPRHVNAWNWIRRRAFERIAETGAQDFTYAVDEHYYVPPRWLYDNVHFYDEYPREVKVFAGEYAAHIDGLARRFNSEEANRFEGALAEAAFLTGVERNADVVVMASYAPLIARAGWAQWSPDLIWCNGSTSYGTPSYYVQKLYSLYMAEQSLGVTVEGEGLFASLTTGTHTFLKVVNNTAEPKTVKVDGLEMNGAVERIEMAYALTDRNSFAEPEKVIPVHTLETVSEDTITVRPHSFTIFCK
ncbi:MAG: alpha-L-arabinofuranosidase [Firmicutes bacterium]|nr:alpha-L-arabinofuranosidase [Bacillota bacterium]